MITWMTRMSLLDTADDLESSLSFQTITQGLSLLRSMVHDDGVYEDSRPEFRMWEFYESALAAYLVALEASMSQRGVFPFQHFRVVQTLKDLHKVDSEAQFELPPWISDTDVLRSHRSNLVRRWPKEYGSLWRGTPKSMPYIWPFIDRSQPTQYNLFVSSHDKKLLQSGERTLPKDIRERISNL